MTFEQGFYCTGKRETAELPVDGPFGSCVVLSSRRRAWGVPPAQPAQDALATSGKMPALTKSDSRDRGSVFRTSTSAKIGYYFTGMEHRLCPAAIDLRRFAIDLFDLFPLPSHAGNFNLSVLRNPESVGTFVKP